MLCLLANSGILVFLESASLPLGSPPEGTGPKSDDVQAHSSFRLGKT